jgi:thiol:disulfide interchange protein
VGAAALAPRPGDIATFGFRLALVLLLLAVWLYNRSWRVALGVALVLAAGVFVRWTSGSYVGVQESGLIGVARLTVVATLAYGVLRLGLFRRGEHASIAPSRSSLASQRV